LTGSSPSLSSSESDPRPSNSSSKEFKSDSTEGWRLRLLVRRGEADRRMSGVEGRRRRGGEMLLRLYLRPSSLVGVRDR
jgi:hypothetical protein